MASLAVRWLCTAYLALSLFLQWLISWLLQMIFIGVSYPFISVDRRADICGHIFRFVSFIGMDLLNPFWGSTVTNSFPEVKPRADGKPKRVILMMNHLSNADPFVCIRSMLPRDGTWVAKDDLFRNPLGGWAMSNADDLRVVFADKSSGFETIKGTVGPMMLEAAKKVHRGRMLCIYPEGTRNPNPAGPLQPFRLGFFTLAIDNDVTIVPLALSGTEKTWPRDSNLLDNATCFFTFGEPVEASKFGSAQELADHVWKIINDLREKHPDRIALREQNGKKQQ